MKVGLDPLDSNLAIFFIIYSIYIMAYTRGAKRRSLSRKRSYARRVRRSHCRGKGPAACRGTSGCKYSSGKKRSFCRKNKNTKRMRGGNTTHGRAGGNSTHGQPGGNTTHGSDHRGMMLNHSQNQ